MKVWTVMHEGADAEPTLFFDVYASYGRALEAAEANAAEMDCDISEYTIDEHSVID